MRIYISNCGNYDYEDELYEPLRQLDLYKQHQFFLSSEPQNADINLKDMLGKVDLMIAEVSYPSTGQGIELGRADAAGIPVVCLYKTGSALSSSLQYITSNIQSYETTAELIALITSEVERADR